MNMYCYTNSNPINFYDANGLWYINLNLTAGFWGGATGGLLFDQKGVHYYFGGGLTTPKASASLTFTTKNVSDKWTGTLQGVGGIAVNAVVEDLNSPCNVPNERNIDFAEVGIGVSFPTFWGASLTATKANKLFDWPNYSKMIRDAKNIINRLILHK